MPAATTIKFKGGKAFKDAVNQRKQIMNLKLSSEIIPILLTEKLYQSYISNLIAYKSLIYRLILLRYC